MPEIARYVLAAAMAAMIVSAAEASHISGTLRNDTGEEAYDLEFYFSPFVHIVAGDADGFPDFDFSNLGDSAGEARFSRYGESSGIAAGGEVDFTIIFTVPDLPGLNPHVYFYTWTDESGDPIGFPVFKLANLSFDLDNCTPTPTLSCSGLLGDPNAGMTFGRVVPIPPSALLLLGALASGLLLRRRVGT